MTIPVEPRQALILDDDWEPPPRANRPPVFLIASLLVTASALFVSVRAGVWNRGGGLPLDAEAEPLVVSRSDNLWYPQDSVESSWSPFRGGILVKPHAPSPRVPPPRPPPPPPPIARRATQSVAGYLSINSTPWAEIAVDGNVVGNTPQLGIRMTPGRHELVFMRNGFEVRRIWVTVAPGATVRVTDIELTRIAP